MRRVVMTSPRFQKFDIRDLSKNTTYESLLKTVCQQFEIDPEFHGLAKGSEGVLLPLSETVNVNDPVNVYIVQLCHVYSILDSFICTVPLFDPMTIDQVIKRVCKDNGWQSSSMAICTPKHRSICLDKSERATAGKFFIRPTKGEKLTCVLVTYPSSKPLEKLCVFSETTAADILKRCCGDDQSLKLYNLHGYELAPDYKFSEDETVRLKPIQRTFTVNLPSGGTATLLWNSDPLTIGELCERVCKEHGFHRHFITTAQGCLPLLLTDQADEEITYRLYESQRNPPDEYMGKNLALERTIEGAIYDADLMKARKQFVGLKDDATPAKLWVALGMLGYEGAVDLTHVQLHARLCLMIGACKDLSLIKSVNEFLQ
jgi:hypothetical protein